MRISTTWLENYRLICQTDWADEAELIAQIKGKPFEATPAMRFETAWQHLLEHGPTGTDETTERDGFTFRANDIGLAVRCIPSQATPEVKTVKEVVIDGQSHQIVGKCDAIYGSWIFENKTKLTTPSLSDYEPSLQWRMYLWLFDAYVVQYNVFQFDSKGSELRDITKTKFFRYQELEADCLRWIKYFLEWWNINGEPQEATA
jgi:hypothetical protein